MPSELMNAAVYDALREVGVSEEKARAAARSVAGVSVDTDAELNVLHGQMDLRFAEVRGDLKLLKWMMGFTLAALVAIVFMLIRLSAGGGA